MKPPARTPRRSVFGGITIYGSGAQPVRKSTCPTPMGYYPSAYGQTAVRSFSTRLLPSIAMAFGAKNSLAKREMLTEFLSLVNPRRSAPRYTPKIDHGQ